MGTVPEVSYVSQFSPAAKDQRNVKCVSASFSIGSEEIQKKSVLRLVKISKSAIKSQRFQ